MVDWALFGFVFFGLFSPGPNVILLTRSGAQFGVGPTLPHVFGVVVGVGIIAGVTAAGIGALLAANPTLTFALRVIAACWIAFMAYRLWTADPGAVQSGDRPFTFPEAVLFQAVNPKLWAVCLSAMAFVADLPVSQQVQVMAATFSGLNFLVCFFWTLTGGLLSYLLREPAAWKLFNRIMSAGLAVFAILVFL